MLLAKLAQLHACFMPGQGADGGAGGGVGAGGEAGAGETGASGDAVVGDTASGVAATGDAAAAGGGRGGERDFGHGHGGGDRDDARSEPGRDHSPGAQLVCDVVAAVAAASGVGGSPGGTPHSPSSASECPPARTQHVPSSSAIPHVSVPPLDIWEEGGYWIGRKRPLADLTSAWATVKKKHQSRWSPAFRAWCDARDPGAVLESVRVRGSFEESLAELGPRTLVHGDFKVNNLFLQRPQNHDRGGGGRDGGDGAPSRPPVPPLARVLDWQWAGIGPGSLDLAHFLCTSLHDSVHSSPEALDALVEHYQAELVGALQRREGRRGSHDHDGMRLGREGEQGRAETGSSFSSGTRLASLSEPAAVQPSSSSMATAAHAPPIEELRRQVRREKCAPPPLTFPDHRHHHCRAPPAAPPPPIIVTTAALLLLLPPLAPPFPLPPPPSPPPPHRCSAVFSTQHPSRGRIAATVAAAARAFYPPPP